MALYLEQFVESLAPVPAEVRRSLRLLRDLDEKAVAEMRRVDGDAKVYVRAARAMTPRSKAKSYEEIRARLSAARTLCDDKVALATQTYELVDRHIRRLDADLQRFEADIKKRLFGSKKELKAAAERAAAVHSGGESDNEDDAKGKKAKVGGRTPKASRKRKADEPASGAAAAPKSGKKRAKLASTTTTTGSSGTPQQPDGAQSPSTAATDRLAGLSGPALLQQLAGGDAHVLDMPVDPDEPTYCVCKQVSFGEMIGCDNDDCPVEWFHFECVGIASKPKGKWYCPNCSEMRKRKQ